MNRSKNIQFIFIAVIACLSLGLAPFFPEPHIWGKIKWVLGGGVGMEGNDYFDLLLHGAPWVALFTLLVWRRFLKG